MLSLETYTECWSTRTDCGFRSRLRHRPTDHGPAVPDSGSGPSGISCPCTHPLVSSVHGPTAGVHLGLGTASQGVVPGGASARLRRVPNLDKGNWT